MTIQTIFLLVAIGLIAGAMSGFVGIGGGVIMVPALIYFMGMTQHAAQGTSLFLMLPPIGILAVMNYWKAGELNWKYGAVIAVAFIIGGYFGSKIALKLSAALVKIIFGVLMLYISIKMIYSGYKGGGFSKNETTHSTTIESDT
ncbi:MAG: sulfite exporter TauE/SafE family protein [Crocinitomicaceae bacterium]|nr:sulfite exporter TauE/SafE family protein [Crocinitomicaceae bacterium]